MKLTTVVIAAAVLAGAAGAAASASANAIIFDKYDYGAPGDVTSDGAVLFVENNGSVAFTDVTISGGFAGGSEDFGALAAGASTGQFYMGDNEYGPDGTALVTITNPPPGPLCWRDSQDLAPRCGCRERSLNSQPELVLSRAVGDGGPTLTAR